MFNCNIITSHNGKLTELIHLYFLKSTSKLCVKGLLTIAQGVCIAELVSFLGQLHLLLDLRKTIPDQSHPPQ